MDSNKFKELLSSIESLTPTQSRRLRETLAQGQGDGSSLAVIEAAKAPVCAHCESERVVRNGRRRGLQRWLCRECGKTSNATSGTPLSRLRDKELFAAYAECMRQGLTIRATARELGMTIDKAFRWRHRFLENAVDHQPEKVSGLLEVDETYFRRSQKGSRKMARAPRRRGGGQGGGGGRSSDEWVPVLVGRVRGQPFTTDRVLERVSGTEVSKALAPVVKDTDTVVCTDGHAAYERLGERLGVTTKQFVASYDGHVREGGFHVQNVNNYHGRLQGWILYRLRGVATKYLSNYLAWMRLMSWKHQGIDADEIVTSAMGRQAINR